MNFIDRNAGLIAILDSTFRNYHTSLSVFQKDVDWEMFIDIDIIYLIEYSWQIFSAVANRFNCTFTQLKSLRIISYIFFLKLHTDIILIRPYSFAYQVLSSHTHIARDISQFLAAAKQYEEIFLYYAPNLAARYNGMYDAEIPENDSIQTFENADPSFETPMVLPAPLTAPTATHLPAP